MTNVDVRNRIGSPACQFANNCIVLSTPMIAAACTRELAKSCTFDLNSNSESPSRRFLCTAPPLGPSIRNACPRWSDSGSMKGSKTVRSSPTSCDILVFGAWMYALLLTIPGVSARQASASPDAVMARLVTGFHLPSPLTSVYSRSKRVSLSVSTSCSLRLFMAAPLEVSYLYGCFSKPLDVGVAVIARFRQITRAADLGVRCGRMPGSEAE